MIKRLTSEHPLFKRVEKLFDIMDDMKLSFEVSRYDGLIVVDGAVQRDARCRYQILDLEENPDAHTVSYIELPPQMEFKLVYDADAPTDWVKK